MKKRVIGVCFLGLLIMSTGIVIPQVSSQPLIKVINKIEQHKIFIDEKDNNFNRKEVYPTGIIDFIKNIILFLIQLIYTLIDIIKDLMDLVNLIGFLIDLIYLLMDMIQTLIDAILNLVPSSKLTST